MTHPNTPEWWMWKHEQAEPDWEEKLHRKDIIRVVRFRPSLWRTTDGVAKERCDTWCHSEDHDLPCTLYYLYSGVGIPGRKRIYGGELLVYRRDGSVRVMSENAITFDLTMQQANVEYVR